MQWSVTDSKIYRRCPRQWYFYRLFSSHRARDPARRKAFRLGKLQSISAWRGSVVDDVLSETLIPALGKNVPLGKKQLMEKALETFDRQLEVARQHRVFEDGIKFSEEKDFAAFHSMEYSGKVPKKEIETARCEVQQAITNLFSYEMGLLREKLKKAKYVAPQRSIWFRHTDISARATPDVTAFFSDEPPLIVDWKVHAFGQHEAWLQLGVYAIALVRGTLPANYTGYWEDWSEGDIQLMEAQLLTNRLREYRLTEEDARQLDQYIASSIVEMQYAVDGRKPEEMQAEEFPVTKYPDECDRCQYRALCWEENGNGRT